MIEQPPRTLTVALWREDSWFIAQCLTPDVASQGDTEDEALLNLKEALRLHLSQPCAPLLEATLPPSAAVLVAVEL